MSDKNEAPNPSRDEAQALRTELEGLDELDDLGVRIEARARKEW